MTSDIKPTGGPVADQPYTLRRAGEGHTWLVIADGETIGLVRPAYGPTGRRRGWEAWSYDPYVRVDNRTHATRAEAAAVLAAHQRRKRS